MLGRLGSPDSSAAFLYLLHFPSPIKTELACVPVSLVKLVARAIPWQQGLGCRAVPGWPLTTLCPQIASLLKDHERIQAGQSSAPCDDDSDIKKIKKVGGDGDIELALAGTQHLCHGRHAGCRTGGAGEVPGVVAVPGEG